jgi:hypothetical protein
MAARQGYQQSRGSPGVGRPADLDQHQRLPIGLGDDRLHPELGPIQGRDRIGRGQLVRSASASKETMCTRRADQNNPAATSTTKIAPASALSQAEKELRETEALVAELERKAVGDPKTHARKIGPERDLLDFSKRHLAQLRQRKEKLAQAHRLLVLEGIREKAAALAELPPALSKHLRSAALAARAARDDLAAWSAEVTALCELAREQVPEHAGPSGPGFLF